VLGLLPLWSDDPPLCDPLAAPELWSWLRLFPPLHPTDNAAAKNAAIKTLFTTCSLAWFFQATRCDDPPGALDGRKLE